MRSALLRGFSSARPLVCVSPRPAALPLPPRADRLYKRTGNGLECGVRSPTKTEFDGLVAQVFQPALLMSSAGAAECDCAHRCVQAS